jgi:asparagine synthase (glutamine-hydrolysing)
MALHFGEPYADPSALPTWLLSKEARAHVTVALAGDGGDEAFAGYDWYETASRLEGLSQRIPSRVARLGAQAFAASGRWLPAGFARIGRGIDLLAKPSAGQRFAALRSFINAPDAQRLYAGELLDKRELGDDPLRDLYAAYDRADGPPLRRMRYVDIESYLADDLMPKVDVASMAHGLEVRAPLLDHEVLRFALSLPDSHLRDATGGKRILRDLLYRYLPREFFDRPKHGFTVPLSRWFRGELKSRMESLADSPALRSLGVLQPAAIRNLVEESAAGRRDNDQRLFNLLMLDEWLTVTA